MGTLLPRQRGTRTSPAACRHAATNGHGPVRSLGTLYRVRSLRASRRLSRYVVRSLRASRRTPRPWSDRTGACRATCSSAPDNIGTPPPPIVSHACASEYLRGVPTPTHGYARCHSTSRAQLYSLALARTPVRTATAPVTAPPKRRRAHRVFTECSQDDARGGRCLWFWRLRRRAIRSREDQKRRGAARLRRRRGAARVVRAVRGGESRRAQRFSVRRCRDGVA